MTVKDTSGQPGQPDQQSQPGQPGLPSQPGLRAWRNAVFTAFILSGFALASWVSRLPGVRDFLGVSTGELGVLILGLSGGSVLGLMIANPLLARFGAARGMAGALVLAGAALLLIGFGSTIVPSPEAVFVGLLLFGVGQGSCDVMMNVQGAMVEQQVGKTLMPLLHASFSFGTMAGAGIGALAAGIGVPVIWHLGAVGVLVAVLICVAARHLPPAAPPATGKQLGWKTNAKIALSAWAEPRVLLIGVIMLGMSFAEGSANDWIAVAAVDGHGVSNSMGALVFGIFVTSMTAGRLLGGPVLDRVGRVPVLRVSAVAAFVGLGLFIFSPWVPLALVGTVLWGLGASLGFPVGMSAAADDPAKAGARVSAVAMIGYFAFLVGPPLLGLVGEHVGLLKALLIVLALIVAAGLAAPAARRRKG
ncbi:MFS transporter [Saxibacter everestensis]|uniref:MFS transporter n=1 Tax=Saxibacter everestensis TaxID=2909229 RepID=A0ABY8QW52_9MICO|nr:MFS transporter [Brevibacteriaceae bacterium ZFBP1038]